MYTAHIRCQKVDSLETISLHSVSIVRGELADVHALLDAELANPEWRIEQIFIMPGSGLTDTAPNEIHVSLVDFIKFYSGIRFKVKN